MGKQRRTSSQTFSKDKKFNAYIVDKQGEYEEGQAMSTNQLMEWALAKYKMLKLKELWEAPMEEDEKMLTLEARIESVNKK